jgi:hypothetical protein
MHMQLNDTTKFWALSTSVLTKCLELVGFSEIRQIVNVPVRGLAQYRSRFIAVAGNPRTIR